MPIADLPRPVAAATIVAALALGTPARSSGAEAWVRIDTPHFSLLTNQDPRTGRNVALEFERARAVFRDALGDDDDDVRESSASSLSILIFAVEDRRALHELLPGLDAEPAFPIGVFQSSPDRHRIAVRLDEPSTHRFQTVYHEYHHLLLRSRPHAARAPVWLVEGLAEFWSHMESTRGDRESIAIGQPSPRHFRTLQRIGRMPLARLLRYDGSIHDEAPERIAVFYAQSWALVHHLMLDAGSGAAATATVERARARIERYLERLGTADDSVTAFEATFGPVAAVERALGRYLDQTMFPVLKVEMPEIPPASRFRIGELSEAQAQAAIGTFVATGPWPEAASEHLERALELEPENTGAMEGMGFLSSRRGELEEAEGWFRRASEADETSFLAHFYLGVLVGLRSGPRELIEKSLERAIELNPAFVPAYVALSAHLAEKSSRLERALALAEEATRLAPEASAVWENLAEILVRMDRLDEAQAARKRARR